jgi:hypothetical protein
LSACSGGIKRATLSPVPTQAETQYFEKSGRQFWIPAFAGMNSVAGQCVDDLLIRFDVLLTWGRIACATDELGLPG